MRLMLVTGGTRSGKSARAEALAAATGLPVTYVATGAAVDDEMRARIAAHRDRRPDAWTTVEPSPGSDPLAAAIAVAHRGGCALIDGLGGWIATAQHEDPAGARDVVLTAARGLARHVACDRSSTRDPGGGAAKSGDPSAPGDPSDAGDPGGVVIVVAEQAGAGLTPLDASSRAWVDLLGEVTQAIAACADRAEVVVAGRVVVLPARPADIGAAADRDIGARPPDDDLAALRVHGDTMVRPGDADHAVNVLRDGLPGGLRAALHTALDADAGRYPDERAAARALAALHGRDPAEVVPTCGAVQALWLLGPALLPRRAAVVHPAFTETEAGLRAHRVPVVRVHRAPDDGFALDPASVPEDADLVVVGNPASPSGTLDPAAAILALRRPGRTVVVDEAFMDLVPGEPGSLCAAAPDDVVVVRSLTKSLALPGLRAGYALAAPALADRLRAVRPPWSVNALALAALAAVAARPEVLARAAERAAAEREDLAARLTAIDGVRTWPAHANFVLCEVADGPAVVDALRAARIAVRPAASFPGLHDGHLRLTARDPRANALLADVLAAAVGTTAPATACTTAPEVPA